jgi:hypothetical protein
MMKYLQAFSLAVSLLSFIAEMKREGGDKESAFLGLGELIARAAGAKEEEVSLIVPEFKRLFSAISALRED